MIEQYQYNIIRLLVLTSKTLEISCIVDRYGSDLTNEYITLRVE